MKRANNRKSKRVGLLQSDIRGNITGKDILNKLESVNLLHYCVDSNLANTLGEKFN